ncbi:ABC transporter ATP-binding protein [Dehalococcoidia bacterium]|nr:ABC transporter ATP-binding protein [Dehalococcoidia bacterium]
MGIRYFLEVQQKKISGRDSFMLEVTDIRFSYSGRPVLNGLSFAVATGELLGVVGPNGSGKTTLLKLVTGVLSPDAGAVTLNGVGIIDLRSRERARQIAVVPQDPQLPEGFSVLDLILMGRNPYLGLFQWESKFDLQVANSAMEYASVTHLAGRKLDELSGGERQRVVVAMALAQQAPVLVLDEPISNLDMSHSLGIMNVIRCVQGERKGVSVVAMHDLTLASMFCDRLMMIAGGRCFVIGSPQEVVTADNIRQIYGASVVILEHPKTGTPVVVPSSGPNMARDCHQC